MVSVPYGVFVFLNETWDVTVDHVSLFPSPTGSSYFSIVTDIKQVELKQFPSPTGSSYFSMEHNSVNVNVVLNVSVPYGVFVFLNDGYATTICTSVTVSVPYGVFVFLNKMTLETLEERRAGFRPLRGLRISQFPSSHETIKSFREKGFRPLRGLRISQL